MYGKALILANPTARNGKAAGAAAHILRILERIRSHDTEQIASVAIHYTVAPFDATEYLLNNATCFDTVILVGGDGIVNEAVNGLMRIPTRERPAIALVPCGNGNDFARSINMSRNLKDACEQIESNSLIPRQIDVCRANDRWFVETLSFGLDAAIALATQKLRKKTHRGGTALYIQAGLDQLKNHRTVHSITLQTDRNEPLSLSCYLLTIQNGMSYGGGFKVCPQARLDDGLLDLCYAAPTLSFPNAAFLFGKALQGKHIKDKHIHFLKAKHIRIYLKDPIASQIDGERFEGSEVEIKLYPKDLAVLMPQ